MTVFYVNRINVNIIFDNILLLTSRLYIITVVSLLFSISFSLLIKKPLSCSCLIQQNMYAHIVYLNN